MAAPNASVPVPNALLGMQVLQAAVRPNITVGELVNVCEADPAFVLRLLTHVNSASFGFSRRVTSAQHAVSLLGVRGVRNLALTSCVVEMAPSGSAGELILAQCLRRGVAARLIAGELREVSAEDAFTVGVLLEVGLLACAREDAMRAASIAQAPAISRAMLERADGGLDHAKRGAKLAKTWHLSEELASAIAQHHEREVPLSPLAAAGWIAERMAGVFEAGDVTANRVAAVTAAAEIGLSSARVDDLLAKIPSALEEIATDLGRRIGSPTLIGPLLWDPSAQLVEVQRSYADVVRRVEALLQEREALTAELRRANDKLSSLALTDALTGLPNVRAFREALQRDVARADRGGSELSLVVVGGDHLRRLHEAHGGEVGVAMLQTIGTVMRESVRVSDVAARIGDGQFALLLPGTDRDGALVVAQRLQVTLARRAVVATYGEVHVNVNMGVATLRGPGCRGREQALIEAADNALVLADRFGRNRIEVGEP